MRSRRPARATRTSTSPRRSTRSASTEYARGAVRSPAVRRPRPSVRHVLRRGQRRAVGAVPQVAGELGRQDPLPAARRTRPGCRRLGADRAAAALDLRAGGARVPADVPDVYVIAPDTAAVGLRDAVPDGAADYVSSVRPQPDAWGGVRLVAGPADPCLPGSTRAEAVELAHARAAELGASDGARLLSTGDWATPQDWIDSLFVPLVTGGSVVFVRNAPDDTVVERRMAQERATVRL